MFMENQARFKWTHASAAWNQDQGMLEFIIQNHVVLSRSTTRGKTSHAFRTWFPVAHDQSVYIYNLSLSLIFYPCANPWHKHVKSASCVKLWQQPLVPVVDEMPSTQRVTTSPGAQQKELHWGDLRSPSIKTKINITCRPSYCMICSFCPFDSTNVLNHMPI